VQTFSQRESAQRTLPKGRRRARLTGGRLRSRWGTGRHRSAREAFLSASANNQSRALAVYFYAFDLLNRDGESLVGVAIERRRELLGRLLAAPEDPLRFTDHRLSSWACSS
jgi:hypothetical protein